MDLTPYYGWIKLLHIVGAFAFVMAHGVSVWASEHIKKERDVERLRALLNISAASLGTMYGGLAILLVGGILAGIVGNHFGRGWIWASLAILVVIVVAMYLLASRYYAQVRRAVGLPSMLDGSMGGPSTTLATREELDRLLATNRADLLAVIGLVGLLVILGLMVLKPF